MTNSQYRSCQTEHQSLHLPLEDLYVVKRESKNLASSLSLTVLICARSRVRRTPLVPKSTNLSFIGMFTEVDVLDRLVTLLRPGPVELLLDSLEDGREMEDDEEEGLVAGGLEAGEV